MFTTYFVVLPKKKNLDILISFRVVNSITQFQVRFLSFYQKQIVQLSYFALKIDSYV
jgi:hypothetical protein